jgi:hypothetical protein
MAKKQKHTESEVVVTYKKKRGRPSGLDPLVAWHIELDGESVGYSTSLNGVSSILYDMGWKVWAYRRTPDKKGRPKFKARVVRFDKEKEL